MPRVRTALVVLVFAVLCASCQKSRTVLLFNNTPVDLRVHLDGKVMDIAPGQSAEALLRGARWIDFGIIAHRYDFGAVNLGSPSYGTPSEALRVQVERDGRLFIIPLESPFPASVLPAQPSGFPLKPAEKVDLT